MKMLNQVPIEIQAELVRRICEETRSRQGEHTIKYPVTLSLLKAFGLDSKVVISISPEIRLQFLDTDVPRGMRTLTLDLLALNEGDPNCDHQGINLYWETGGYSSGSWYCHTHKMCRLCGYSEPPPMKTWLQRLIRKILLRN